MIVIFNVRNKTNYFAMFVSVFIAEVTGLLSSYFTRGSMKGYYATLIKPSFAPAPWVYSIVWPIMYLLMGLAAYRIWMNRKLNIKAMRGLTYYLIQLFFNFVWSIVFFGMKLQMVSVICIFLLLGLVMITTKAFAKVDKKARNLMIPYVLWTMFATVLNVSIWYLNM